MSKVMVFTETATQATATTKFAFEAPFTMKLDKVTLRNHTAGTGANTYSLKVATHSILNADLAVAADAVVPTTAAVLKKNAAITGAVNGAGVTAVSRLATWLLLLRLLFRQVVQFLTTSLTSKFLQLPQPRLLSLELSAPQVPTAVVEPSFAPPRQSSSRLALSLILPWQRLLGLPPRVSPLQSSTAKQPTPQLHLVDLTLHASNSLITNSV